MPATNALCSHGRAHGGLLLLGSRVGGCTIGRREVCQNGRRYRAPRVIGQKVSVAEDTPKTSQ